MVLHKVSKQIKLNKLTIWGDLMSNPKMLHERRSCVRLPFSVSVNLFIDGQLPLSGKVINAGLKGIYVEMDPHYMPTQRLVFMTLPEPALTALSLHRFPMRVVRKTESGVALAFTQANHPGMKLLEQALHNEKASPLSSHVAA